MQNYRAKKAQEKPLEPATQEEVNALGEDTKI